MGEQVPTLVIYHKDARQNNFLIRNLQFFVLAIILFYGLYVQAPRPMVLVTLAITVSSIVAVWWITNEDSLTQTSAAAQDITYDKPYYRVSSYLLGVLLSIAYVDYFKQTSPFVGRKVLANFLLFLSCFGILVIGYVPYWYYNPLHNPSDWSNGAYAALSRPCWALCLATLTFLCILNEGGFVASFLSQWWWDPLGKLSFAAYLVHPILMRITYYSLTSLIHIGSIEHAVYATAFITLAYMLALIL